MAELPTCPVSASSTELKQSAPTASAPTNLDHVTDLIEDHSISAYAKWGGLPAALASTADFERVRAEDAQIRAMFSMLDHLEQDIAAAGQQAGREIELLVAAFARTGLTARELSRLNSPLLDGLWKIVTGRDATDLDDTSMRSNAPLCFHVLLLRCTVPKPHGPTLSFLLRHWPRLNAIDKTRHIEVAAATGHMEVLQQLLRPRASSVFFQQLLERAAGNDHWPAADLIQSIAATAFPRKEYTVVLQHGITAAAKNCLLYTSPSPRD